MFLSFWRINKFLLSTECRTSWSCDRSITLKFTVWHRFLDSWLIVILIVWNVVFLIVLDTSTNSISTCYDQILLHRFYFLKKTENFLRKAFFNSGLILVSFVLFAIAPRSFIKVNPRRNPFLLIHIWLLRLSEIRKPSFAVNPASSGLNGRRYIIGSGGPRIRLHRHVQINLQDVILTKWKVLHIFFPKRIKINLKFPKQLFFIFLILHHLQYHLHLT